MANIISIAILAIIIGLAAGYIYRAKRRGQKCIGCPCSSCGKDRQGSCGGNCSGCR